MKNIKLLIVFLLLVISFMTKAQLLGSGSDGSPTITWTEYTDVLRARVTSIVPMGGGIDLIVDNSTGSWPSTGKVLVILMAQTGPNPTRNWQMADITGATGGGSTWTLSVTNFAHTNWCTTASSTCKIQVIKVKEYDYPTLDPGGVLTCDPWNGFTGGVLCFLAKNDLTINSGGVIDVSGKGFSNTNMGGFGGPGGVAMPAPGLNTTPNPGKGNDGLATSFPFFAPGQCVSPITNGGDGGTGGFQIPGFSGLPGDLPETRQSLPKPVPPKLLFMGNGGKEGNGGRGGNAGGSGSNGGNGFFPAPNTGGPGTGGTSGSQGGDGGTGGGVIIVLANNVFIPHSSTCINISGTSGFLSPNVSPATSPAIGGTGGDGGDASPYMFCQYVGYGALGIKGQRGDGASGGAGGSGGSIGSCSIRTTPGNTNDLNKSLHVTYIPGAPGPGGMGQFPFPSSASDGRHGCPEDMFFCPGTTPCTTKKYTPYKWACYEAYRVLADMDVATDFGGYIKYTKSGGAAFSKKNGNAISTATPDYYCLYYKCSKLLMAFEDDGNPPNPMADIACRPWVAVITHFEQGANLYWCKLQENPCGTCDAIHVNHYLDILSGLAPYSGNSTLGGSSDPVTFLNYDHGWVEFGNDNAGSTRFRYEDLIPYDYAGNGKLFEITNPSALCTKSTEEFRMEWIDLYTHYPCICLPPGGGPGPGPGGPPPPPEVYPPLPYIPELWDNPKKGDDGPPGDPGEGDDSYFDGGDFDPGQEDGMSELLGIENITAAGKHFTVSPNPTGNQLSVLITGKENIHKADIKILDITGKVVFEKQGCSISNKTLVQDISKLQAGTYFISISAKNVSEVLKFVKQ